MPPSMVAAAVLPLCDRSDPSAASLSCISFTWEFALGCSTSVYALGQGTVDAYLTMPLADVAADQAAKATATPSACDGSGGSVAAAGTGAAGTSAEGKHKRALRDLSLDEQEALAARRVLPDPRTGGLSLDQLKALAARRATLPDPRTGGNPLAILG